MTDRLEAWGSRLEAASGVRLASGGLAGILCVGMDTTSRSSPSLRGRLVVALLAALSACAGGCTQGPATVPWGADTVTAADLVKELGGADRPVVVCTALPSMYRTGHIPGAVLQGPGMSPAALQALTSWAQPLPRTTSLVIYCGCCPIDHCPNLQPPYTVLKAMGFERVRVLLLPENFDTDWAARGYPLER